MAAMSRLLRDVPAARLFDEVLKLLMSGHVEASYALARETGVRDERMIDDICARIAQDDYSLRAAIHAIVAHESFRRE